jgi:hypothetical protein
VPRAQSILYARGITFTLEAAVHDDSNPDHHAPDLSILLHDLTEAMWRWAACGAQDDIESEYIFSVEPARFYLCQNHRSHHLPCPDFAPLRFVADPMSKPATNSQDEADGELPKEPPNLIIGLDTRNQWVVIETHGLCGGIFISQAAALRYARQESRGHPDSVHFVPYLVVFDLSAPKHAKGW